ncbi:hypothetical protein [Streptomyces lannensis]|uniref:Histidine kinase n=1 Tax=Streptomyces lannensis TaxID=766498 RepID=A0ABP7M0P7_9ACTN
MALAYLVCVAGSLAALAVALWRRPARSTRPPTAPAPTPAALPTTAEREVRAILTAAAQLAARLDTAA